MAVIIAPWNFPLAILTGMTAAALVSGNCAIMKPAMPAQIVAHLLHAILLEAGFPPDSLPARAGTRRARSATRSSITPDVQVIAFTGSREVGLRILERSAKLAPGQLHVKRVVCEMGGKNAIIVDDDADLDEAVAQTLHSAFGYQGQKCSACSRLIAVGGMHDRLVERLVRGARCVPVRPARRSAIRLRPAHHARSAAESARLHRDRRAAKAGSPTAAACPETGYYAPPAIFTGIVPQHRLAQEEIFGPVLVGAARARASSRRSTIALDSQYALTGGVFSRYPSISRSRASAFASAISISTAASPARASACSRSAATGSPAKACRRAATSISSSSCGRASSPRTRSATGTCLECSS